MKKVAVWIPVYNEGAFLRETIESILSQTYADLDLIISNNHSTDNSSEIIDDYKNIILWKPQKHCTSLEHWEFVWSKLKETDYDFFVHFGGHDIIKENYIELLVDAFDKNQSASIVCGKGFCLSKTGDILGEYTGKTPQLIGQYKPFNPFGIIAFTSSNAAMHGLIPAEIIKKVNVRYKCPAVDVFLIAEISTYGDVIYVPDAVVFMRSSGTDVNEYLNKHMGVVQEDSSEMIKLLNMQMSYVNDVSDVACGNYFTEDLKNIYKASLMGMYFIKWCGPSFVDGSLSQLGDIVPEYLSQMSRIGSMTESNLKKFFSEENLREESLVNASQELTNQTHFPIQQHNDFKLAEESSGEPMIVIWMPVFNEAKHLKAAIDSVLNQTFSDFDFIISDNYSTDESSELIDQAVERDPRIKKISPPCHMASLDHAKYISENVLNNEKLKKYSIFIGGHDIWKPNFLQCLWQQAEAEPNASIVYTDCYGIDDMNNIVGQYCSWVQTKDVLRPSIPHHVLLGLTQNIIVYGLWREDKRKQVNFRHTCGAVDHLLVTEMALLGSVIYQPGSAVFLRMNSGGINAYVKKHIPESIRKWPILDFLNQLEWAAHLVDKAVEGSPFHEQEPVRNMLKSSLLSAYICRDWGHLMAYDQGFETFFNHPKIRAFMGAHSNCVNLHNELQAEIRQQVGLI